MQKVVQLSYVVNCLRDVILQGTCQYCSMLLDKNKIDGKDTTCQNM